MQVGEPGTPNSIALYARRPVLLVLRRHRAFVFLLALYLAVALAQFAALPPFEGGDEGLHLAYVLTLMRTGSLPDRADAPVSGVRQASGQPPLFYATTALVSSLLQLPSVSDLELYADLERVKNPWFAPPNQWNPADNRNLYVPEAASARADTGLRFTNQSLRLVALFFGVTGVFAAYGAGYEIFRNRLWVVLTTALFALSPQYVHMSVIVHNDIAVSTLAAACLWQGLRLLRLGASPVRLLILGVLIGLGGLAKINILLLVPACAAAIVLQWYTRSGSGRALLWQLAIVALPTAMLLGPWVLWGWSTYQDPLGIATHQRPGYFFSDALPLAEVLRRTPEVYLGYWGKLASAVYLSPLIYTLLGSLPLLAAFGYVRGMRFPWWKGQLRRQQLVVLSLAVLFPALGLLHWLRTVDFITGRLLYPAHVPIVAAICGGLALLSRHVVLRRPLANWTLGILAFAACFAAPISLLLAYSPPPGEVALSEDLIERPIDFASDPQGPAVIRFLGFTADTLLARAGSTNVVTLCWQVLEASPPSRTAAFSVKLFSQDGQQVADRTSLLGLGRYPSSRWQPGDQICDRVELPISGPVTPGATYNLILVLLDAETMAVDWPARHPADSEPVDIPVIAQFEGAVILRDN